MRLWPSIPFRYDCYITADAVAVTVHNDPTLSSQELFHRDVEHHEDLCELPLHVSSEDLLQDTISMFFSIIHEWKEADLPVSCSSFAARREMQGVHSQRRHASLNNCEKRNPPRVAIIQIGPGTRHGHCLYGGQLFQLCLDCNGGCIVMQRIRPCSIEKGK